MPAKEAVISRGESNAKKVKHVMNDVNSLGQPIGPLVADWTPRPRPRRTVLQGRHCRLEPLDPQRHAADIYDANSRDEEGRLWTYLPYGPFRDLASYREWTEKVAQTEDPLFFAVVNQDSGCAAGVLSFLRIDPAQGSIEVGHINFSPELQHTTVATEAIFLVMRHVFEDLGYRRFEWKCDALNAPSRRAAQRFGFTYEGTFRKAVVVKGRNRDTAWFSIIDEEWPRLKAAYERWLSPANFDSSGHQLVSLSGLTRSRASD